MTNTKELVLAISVLLVACNAEQVEPPDLQATDTDGGLGETGGSESGDVHECWLHDAPASAVRWQCEGQAEAAIMGTLDVKIPSWLEDEEDLIQQIIDYGRYDWAELFGPWAGDTYDDPGVDACCLPELAENLDGGGVDETGDSPEDPAIPQAAVACVHDCADQACRQIPDELRRLAREVPAGYPIFQKSYRKQLEDLADWTALNHADCYHSMVDGGVHENLGFYVVEGTWEIPDNGEWSAITEVSVDGTCSVLTWYLPQQGTPNSCTGINDNNDSGTFEPEESGSSFGGFDTFAPIGGEIRLEGPTVFGIPAIGEAPLLDIGSICQRGECSRLDAWITEESLELKRLVLVTPMSLAWEADGGALVVEHLQVVVEHPRTVPLSELDGATRFEIPAGEVEIMISGEVHGIPVKLSLPNDAPVGGTIIPTPDGSRTLSVEPLILRHNDGFGEWTMEVEVGDWVAVEHSPRAMLDTHKDDGVMVFDGTESFDPDGDSVDLEWFVDGESVGKSNAISPTLGIGLHVIALRASDSAGRSSWRHRVVAFPQ